MNDYVVQILFLLAPTIIVLVYSYIKSKKIVKKYNKFNARKRKTGLYSLKKILNNEKINGFEIIEMSVLSDFTYDLEKKRISLSMLDCQGKSLISVVTSSRIAVVVLNDFKNKLNYQMIQKTLKFLNKMMKMILILFILGLLLKNILLLFGVIVALNLNIFARLMLIPMELHINNLTLKKMLEYDIISKLEEKTAKKILYSKMLEVINSGVKSMFNFVFFKKIFRIR